MDELQIKQLALKIKKANQEGRAWPMLVYREVLELADEWDEDKRGKFDDWLQSECTGKSWTLRQFKKVRDVVECLGEDIRRTWDYWAAQWVYGQYGDSPIKAVILQNYPFWLADNNGQMLSASQVRNRVTKLRTKMDRKVGRTG